MRVGALVPHAARIFRRRDLWAWLLLGLLPLLVNLPALSGAYRYDPIYVVSGLTPDAWTTNGALPGYPWIDGNAGVTTEALGNLAAHDWLRGRLPWWNPFSGAGLPLAAEGQTPAFFLPFVLLLALPHGLLALRIVLMALAGIFSFALLRRMHLDAAASFLGAAVFQLNGTFAWIGHGPMLPVAFLPLMLFGVEVSRARFSIALALGTAWSLAAGFPETAFLDAVFTGLWAFVRCAQAPSPVTTACRVAASAMCGALLAAPAVWPFLEALPREFLGVHQAALSSRLLVQNWALMLLPGLFGAPMANVEALHGSDALWVRAGGYVDVGLVALALTGLRLAARDQALRLAIFGFIAATGLRAAGVAPAVWLFSQIPLLRLTNVHLYMMPAWSMGCAVLAAFAVQDWRDGFAPPWRRAALLLACLLAAVLAKAAPAAGALWHVLPRYVPALLAGAALPACAACLLLLLLRRPYSRFRGGALCVIAAGNACVLCLLPQLTGTHGRRVDESAVRFLQTHAGLSRVLPLGPLVPNYGALIGVAEIGHNYLPVPQNWVDYTRTALHAGPDAVNFYTGWPPDAATLAALLPAYAQAGVRYVLTPSAAPHGASAPVYQDTMMTIDEVPGAAPYWQADGCSLASASRESVVAACAHPAALRRLELFWPGWHATLNGRAVSLSPAGGIFQAISLPAGQSQIVFRYAPPGIVYAWLMCGAGALGIAMAALYSPLRSRRRFSSSSA